MDNKTIEERLETIKTKYMKFMKLHSFPQYDIIIQNITLDSNEAQQYMKAAGAQYDFKTQRHSLIINPLIDFNEYIVFHEFTHILDTEQYANNDRVRYVYLSGYTEYHASQIELLNLLGAKKVNKKVRFKMNQIINTIAGNITVQEYIEDKHNQAIELFNDGSFLVNDEYMIASLGVLFNYWGLRSICEMYAKDYKENKNNDAFLKRIPPLLFNPLDSLMHGFMNDKQIVVTMMQYKSIIGILLSIVNEITPDPRSFSVSCAVLPRLVPVRCRGTARSSASSLTAFRSRWRSEYKAVSSASARLQDHQ